MAASAMAAIVDAVKAYGVDDRDIQTRSFNIWPEYEFPEVSEGGRRVRRQVLVGYRISHPATIKVRDLDAVGDIIDDVADGVAHLGFVFVRLRNNRRVVRETLALRA